MLNMQQDSKIIDYFGKKRLSKQIFNADKFQPKIFSFNAQRTQKGFSAANSIACFIKNQRLSQKINQSDFSESLGISQSTLSRIERGEDKYFDSTLKVLKAIAEITNKSIDQILEERI